MAWYGRQLSIVDHSRAATETMRGQACDCTALERRIIHVVMLVGDRNFTRKDRFAYE